MNEKYYEFLKQHKEYEAWVDRVFLQLGIPQNVKGYDYLMAALLLTLMSLGLFRLCTMRCIRGLRTSSTPRHLASSGPCGMQ